MHKKLNIIIILSLLLALNLKAQEIPFYKQYLFNNFLINPAISGFEDFTPITLIDKHQWIGDIDAPATQLFTLTGKMKKDGYGISILNDKAGRFSTQSMQFSYSHHITLGKKKHFKRRTGRIIRQRPELSLGITFSANRINLDQTGLTTVDFDPAISGKMETANFPDANFGIYYQSKGNFFSFSVQQLFASTVNLYNRDSENNRVQRQYFLMIGKEAQIDKVLSVEPSFMLKANESRQFETDFNLKFIYLNNYWLALTYSRDVNNLIDQNHWLRLYVGVKVFHRFHVAYAYNHLFNGLQINTFGTHQLMLKYNLFEQAKGTRYYY